LKRYLRERRRPSLFFLAGLVLLVLLSGCGGQLPSASWFGIAADDAIVYLAANEQVFALNLESGAEIWSFPSDPDPEVGPFYATPLLTRDLVVVGGFNQGDLYAVSQDVGQEQWTVETEASIVDSTSASQYGIITGNGLGNVFIVDIETQKKRLIFAAQEAVWAAPLVDNETDRVYVPSMDHNLYALDLESEDLLWTFEANGALAGTPALADGVLYFGTLNSRLYAVDAESGTEIWQISTDGWVWGGPVWHGGTLYCGDMAGVVYALDAADGTQRWTFEAEDGVRASPLLKDEQLYFGDKTGTLYALDAGNGTQIWSLPLAGPIYSQPVITGDYLLVAPHNATAKLMALNPESGARVWSYPPEEE
jgi:outer membrane protein assembly factor BamB